MLVLSLASNTDRPSIETPKRILTGTFLENLFSGSFSI
jgi:hypothetical protein